jgi:predicted DNA binding CopG/RHH family protein
LLLGVVGRQTESKDLRLGHLAYATDFRSTTLERGAGAGEGFSVSGTADRELPFRNRCCRHFLASLKFPPAVPDSVDSMQAVDEQELRNGDASLTWWERAPFSVSSSSESPGSGFSTFAGALSAAVAPRLKAQEPTPDRVESLLSDRGQSFTPGSGESFPWPGAFAPAGENTETDPNTDPDTDPDNYTDTASFSYESALRAAGRSPVEETDSVAPDELDQTLLQTLIRTLMTSDLERDRQPDGTRRANAHLAEPDLARSAAASEFSTTGSPSFASFMAKRPASVTIRLSAAECAQLKQRAAEAGLTLSAYVRSCTFEAEALRAQVKQALGELRGELRGDLRKELRGELRGDLRGEVPEKKPPLAESFPPAALSHDSPRHWWQPHSHERSRAPGP